MSILDKIKGEGEGEGGVFNPFRLLDIGEIMVRYCDGIKIKDYVFFGVLTSERFMLIDSLHQSAGVIAKEIPISVIKEATLEKDEKGRPALAINMEIGEQSRIMRLVFTGLIEEPESECREWFTAINGYPPERLEQLEPAKPEEKAEESAPEAPEVPVLDEPAPKPVPERIVQKPEPDIVSKPPLEQEKAPEYEETQKEPEPEPQEIKPEYKQEYTPVIEDPKPEPVTPRHEIPIPPIRQKPPAITRIKREKATPPRRERDARSKKTAPADGSVKIALEKPDIGPIRVQREVTATPHERSGATKFCMYCGSHIPSHAKFCPSCGKQQ